MRARNYTSVGTTVGLLAAVIAATAAEAQQHAHHAHHADHAHRAHSELQVVNVTAEDYAFRVPREIASGWTTFRLENAGQETHMLFIARLPDGVSYEDYMTGAVDPFNEAWYQLRDGRIGSDEVFPLIIDNLEPWYWETQYTGGVGLLAPGATAEATMHLEPGTYVIECYMRTPEGEMHSMEGMIDPLIVTQARSPGTAPRSDARITLSAQGMEMDGELRSGTRTLEVHYADHPEGTFGHNVHVVRLNEGATADQVLDWLNFANVHALVDPAPGVFLGGITPMPAGSTGFFRTSLDPGRYLFVSEFTGPMGVLKEVTVQP